MLHFEGLRKKVIKNYFIIIAVMVVLFEGLFIFYIKNYYYDYVKQSLQSAFVKFVEFPTRLAGLFLLADVK